MARFAHPHRAARRPPLRERLAYRARLALLGLRMAWAAAPALVLGLVLATALTVAAGVSLVVAVL